MANEFEPGNIVLCIDTSGFTNDGWVNPELMEHYTIERVFSDGAVRLLEVNNDAEDSLSAQFTGRGHSDFYSWRFMKVGESEQYWISQIRKSIVKMNHPRNGKISIVEICETSVRFYVAGGPGCVFSASKESLNSYN